MGKCSVNAVYVKNWEKCRKRDNLRGVCVRKWHGRLFIIVKEMPMGLPVVA